MSDEEKKAADIVIKIKNALLVLLYTLSIMIDKTVKMLGIMLSVVIFLVLLGIGYQLYYDAAVHATLIVQPMK